MPDFFLLSPLLSAGGVDNLNGGSVPVDVGQTFNISWVVENSSTTSGSSQITHYISTNNIISPSDVFLGSTTVSNSQSFSGLNQSLIMPSIPNGTYSVGSCYPTFSGNRCSNAGAVTVSSGPDISLFSPLLSSRGRDNLNSQQLTVRVNDSLKISWILENAGDASNNVVVKHYFSKDRVIDQSDVLFGTQTISVERGAPVFVTGLNFTKKVILEPGRYRVATCLSDTDCSLAGSIDVVSEPQSTGAASLPAVYQLLFDD